MTDLTERSSSAVDRLVLKLSTPRDSDALLIVELSETSNEDIIELALGRYNLAKTPEADSWIERASRTGIPEYIAKVAKTLRDKRGMSTSHAIAAAITQLRIWARGGKGVHPDTVAKSQKALAQWEALKAKSKAKTAAKALSNKA